MRVSVITFPGSNCDHDAYEVFASKGHQAELIWHKDTDLKNPDLVVLPGGFSYGDYLRCGALARFSPIVSEVLKHATRGGMIIGICNGFQILTETGLLPGSLIMNIGLKFICQNQYIRVESSNSPYTFNIETGTPLMIPIAHKEGNFYIDMAGLNKLQDEDRIIFRYCNAFGGIDEQSNPNGSIDNIAGICSTNRRVLGMMPHPERSVTESVPGSDGAMIFAALEEYLTAFS
ncbi:MAG: phosphoribosylformylglycinamidine synthase subunit PurQ [Candidatus Cloacimonetes bacterium]|nr:phosphoribosylformylglycinamidine synthase subunit PurQ [Candidatus Cloacimonadota bacterium]